jgi:type 2 lantibiotic biosynthesis protein LanM
MQLTAKLSVTPSDDLRFALLRAMPLAERRRFALTQGFSASSADAAASENARVRKWLAQPPFDTPAMLASRLESEGLTRDEFARIIALDMDELASLIEETPDWVASLRQALFAEVDEDRIPDTSVAGNAKDSVVLVRPLLAQAAATLKDRLRSLCSEWPDSPIDPDGLATLLLADLDTQVANLLVRTVVLELNVARLQNELTGETPEERYQSFLQRLGTPEGRQRLFSEYPVLLRCVQQTIDHWGSAMVEIFSRLREDWPELQSAFFNGEAGALDEIRVGAGDRHREGRTVAILRFSSGVRIVYKPHSLFVDAHFEQFLAWMNERELSTPLRAPRVLARSEYGWTECVQLDTCQSVDGIRRFYRRLGASLAVLYLLGATDFHFENLLACGEYPVLIDLEALFHPQLPPEERRAVKTFLQDAVFHTVSRTGLLPWRVWKSADQEGIDVSGIGGRGGQLAPNPVLVSEAARTDNMKFVRKQIAMEMRHNQPTLNGEQINPRDYESELEEGFSEGYQIFLLHRAELLHAEGPIEAFRNDTVRAIAQQTKIYSDLLRDSYHPNVLRNGLDRDRLLDKLWMTAVTSPHRRLLIPFELEDLRGGDIPFFYTTPDSQSLWSSRNVEIRDYLDRSSFDGVLDTVRRLSAVDLDNQKLVLRSAYATLADGIPSLPITSGHAPARRTPSSIDTAEDTLRADSALRELTQRLTNRAFHRDGFAAWTTLQPGLHGWEVGPTSYDLYSGLAGIGLSLAYLGDALADEPARALASACFSTSFAILDAERDLGRFRSQSIGAFSGRSGLIYAAHQAALLWKDGGLLSRAVELSNELAEFAGVNEKLDIANGAAGALIVLSHLSRSTSEPALRSTSEILASKLLNSITTEGERTVARLPQGEEMPAGFAYGAEGIAYALSVYGKRTGSDEIVSQGAKLFSSCRQTLRGSESSTPEGAAHNSQPPHNFSFSIPSWCHGGAGLAMIRLRMQDSFTSRESSEVDGEIEGLLELGPTGSSCLCHGDAGNAQLLVDAAYLRAEQDKRANLLREAQALLMPAGKAVWKFPTPNGVECPGLMLGLAGFAHGLLRAASTKWTPSIFMLDSLDHQM